MKLFLCVRTTSWLPLMVLPGLFLFSAGVADARLSVPRRKLEIPTMSARISSIPRLSSSVAIHKVYDFPPGSLAGEWVEHNGNPIGEIGVDPIRGASNPVLAFAGAPPMFAHGMESTYLVPPASDVTFRFYIENVLPFTYSSIVHFHDDPMHYYRFFLDPSFANWDSIPRDPYYEGKWLVCQVVSHPGTIVLDNWDPDDNAHVFLDDIVVKAQGSSIPFFGCNLPSNNGDSCCKTLEELYQDVIRTQCNCDTVQNYPLYMNCVEDILNVMVAEHLIQLDEQPVLRDLAEQDGCGGNRDSIPFPEPTHFPVPCLNLPANRIHDGTPQQGWELVPFCDGDCVHSDTQRLNLPLRFPFTIFGQSFTSVTVHINGLVCFGSVRCIYAYLSDVDTSPAQTVNVNHVWFSSGPHGFAVVWDHVTEFAMPPDRYNTFQLLISDGTVETMGGYNVCSCYDAMEWSYFPGVVGAEYLRGSDIEIGHFAQMDDSYNGPGDLFLGDDGVGYLEGRAICYNVDSTLVPPIAVGFPEFPEGSSTFELKACGSPGEVNLAFYFIPGQEGTSIYDVTVNGDIPEGMLVDISQTADGRSYFVYVSWENIYPLDPFELEFVAQDDRSPSLFTTKSIYVQVEDDCPNNGSVEEIDPTTIRPTTISPSTRPVCGGDDCGFVVTESPTTQEPTNPPTEPATEAIIVQTVCDDELGTTFDVAGRQKTCAWLRPRLDRYVSASRDIPNIPAEWTGLLWSEALCGNAENPGVAYEICSESCGRCVDECEDGRVFYEVDGTERTCVWLWSHENQIDNYCNDAVSDANTRCPETCGTCDELGP